MAATRWEFLAPWWRVLQAHELSVASRHQGFHEELHGLCVSIYPRESESDDEDDDPNTVPVHRLSTQIPQLRDALELALLLSIVDREALEQVVIDHVREHAQVDTISLFETHPHDPLTHVELSFDGAGPKPSEAVVSGTIAALATFLVPRWLEDRDPAFQEAREQVLQQILPHETDKRMACANLKISVDIARSQELPPGELVSVVTTANAAALAVDRLPYPFVAARFSVNIQPSMFAPESTSTIESWFSATLPFDRVHITHWHSVLQFGETLSSVFQPRISADRSEAENKFVKVSASEFSDPDRFAQICSALMHTQRVQSVAISLNTRAEENPLDRRRRMQWIFFALFSRWATHSIEEVDLGQIDLSEVEFEDLEQLLASENPLPMLFEATGGGVSRARQVLAPKDSRLAHDPVGQTHSAGRSIVMREDVWLDVISQEEGENGDWWVLVPAFGKCRLRHRDASQVRDSPSPDDQPERRIGCRGIKSLGFDPILDHGRGRGLFPFIQFIGPQLEALSCHGFSFGESDALVPVLACCPSLERLHLQSAHPDLLPNLMEAYAMGACTATSLDLRYLQDQAESPHVARLYETLADSTQPMAQILRELLFCNRAVRWPMPDPEIAVMRMMLERNRVLRYFERTCRPAHNGAFVRLCREFNNTTIEITPVPRRSRLAFLSVVSSESSPLAPTLLRLDTTMITRIFDMAARRVQRKVRVGSYRSMYFH